MCQQVPLEIRPLADSRLDVVLNRLRETHANGGALFASFNVGPSEVFDRFASKNRLLEFGTLRLLLDRVEVANALPELLIQPVRPDDPAFAVRKLKEFADVMKHPTAAEELRKFGLELDYEVGDAEYDGVFRVRNSFVFDGDLAAELYSGGAYTNPQGSGKTEKEQSLAFCDALFGSRFSDIWYCSSHSDWTPWFANVTGDWTAILFDRRVRALSILATTDSD